jgi:hypothetical protein
MSDSKLLDWIFLYVQFVSTSCLVQNVWMESYRVIPSKFWTRYEEDKLNIQGDSIQIKCSRPEYSWKIARWLLNTNQSINPSCMFNLSVLHVWFKTFGWNHPVCSTCSVQNFWMKSSCMFNLSVFNVEQTSWIYRVIPSKLNVLVLNIAEKLLAGC